MVQGRHDRLEGKATAERQENGRLKSVFLEPPIHLAESKQMRPTSENAAAQGVKRALLRYTLLLSTIHLPFTSRRNVWRRRRVWRAASAIQTATDLRCRAKFVPARASSSAGTRRDGSIPLAVLHEHKKYWGEKASNPVSSVTSSTSTYADRVSTEPGRRGLLTKLPLRCAHRHLRQRKRRKTKRHRRVCRSLKRGTDQEGGRRSMASGSELACEVSQ